MFGGLPSRQGRAIAQSRSDLVTLTGETANTVEAFRLLFERADVTPSEIARRVGKTAGTVQNIVRARRPKVTLKTFAEIAAACGGRIVLELPD